MNYFFGFEPQLSENSWLFNLNHLVLFIIVIVAIIGLFFALNAKEKKTIFITKIVLASIMFMLEITRMLWHYLNHVHSVNYLGNEGSFNFWRVFSFQLCAIMVWTTIATLILSVVLMSKNKEKENFSLKILTNIILGVGLVAGFLAFIYPDMLQRDRSLLHFINFQTILQHILLVFVPLYFIKIGTLKVRIKNLWMPAYGYLIAASVAMTTSQLTGENFAFSLHNPLLRDIGINVVFPLHLLVTFLIVFILPAIIFGCFNFIECKKNLSQCPKEIVMGGGNNLILTLLRKDRLIIICSYIVAFILFLTLPLAFRDSPVYNALGLIAIVPAIIAVAGIVAGYRLRHRVDEKIEEMPA